MTVGYRKIAKTAILLLTSLIIATVSAATYRYMYIDGSVTVGSAKLVWETGDDAPGDTSITGSTVTIDLDVEPGVPMNFTECLFLTNNDTAAHNMTISVTTSVSSSDFDELKIHIYQNGSSPTFIDTLDVTTSDTYETYTGNTPLAAGEAYLMTFEVAADSAVTEGTYNFDIQVEYE
jgi:hypothetical protein